MSFTSIRPYFSERLQAVDPDLKEWTDAFNIENIPETVIDKSWHLSFGLASAVSMNQTCLSYKYPVSLDVFFKGYRNPSDAVDTANSYGESILREILKHSNRLTIVPTSAAKIINVRSTIMQVLPIDQSNDNTVRLQMEFEADVYIELE